MTPGPYVEDFCRQLRSLRDQLLKRSREATWMGLDIPANYLEEVEDRLKTLGCALERPEGGRTCSCPACEIDDDKRELANEPVGTDGMDEFSYTYRKTACVRLASEATRKLVSRSEAA